jgi:hypothetical protein
MSFTGRFQTTPEITAKLDQYLQTKNIKGRVKNEMVPTRGAGIAGTVNMPNGWATITVETSDPKLLTELNEFIWKLEAGN